MLVVAVEVAIGFGAIALSLIFIGTARRVEPVAFESGARAPSGEFSTALQYLGPIDRHQRPPLRTMPLGIAATTEEGSRGPPSVCGFIGPGNGLRTTFDRIVTCFVWRTSWWASFQPRSGVHRHLTKILDWQTGRQSCHHTNDIEPRADLLAISNK
jgi:hypothetical protein